MAEEPTQSGANYLTDRWLPSLLDDGTTRMIALREIGRTEDGRTPLRVLGTTPDGGTVRLEFLIGAVQQLMPPDGSGEWLDRYFDPPSPEWLGSLIESSGLVPHFDLFGTTPAFQDPSVAKKPEQSVSSLFLLQPGEQTRDRNQDIWGKDITAVGIPEVMAALYGLQIHSPAGGRDVRTAISGGGALRTYLTGGTLWSTVWGNILPKSDWLGLGNGAADVPSLVPWVKSPGKTPTPVNAPSSHLFWSCPRRILLAPPEQGLCEITGQSGPVVRRLRTEARGPDYKSELWRHPLSPYYRMKKGGKLQRLPRLGGTVSSGLSWRDYVGLFQEKGEAGDVGVEPALTVRAWRQERASDTGEEVVRVQVFGYRCDKAKVLGTVASSMPFLTVPPAVEKEFSGIVEKVVEGAGKLASAVKNQTLAALFDANTMKKNVPSAYGGPVETDFWARTEAPFRSFAKALRDHLSGGGAPNDPAAMALLTAIHGALGQTALRLFDERVDVGQTDDPERVVTAKRNLRMTVLGAPVRAAFGLPVDKTKKAGRNAKAKEESQ